MTSKPIPTKHEKSKSVHFAATMRVRMFTPREEPYSETWYTPEEYDTFMAECQSTIDIAQVLIEHNRSLPRKALKHFCSRGLEHQFSPDARAARKYRRTQALDAVYTAQSFQDSVDYPGEESLAEVYHPFSVASLMDAHARAIRYRIENEDDEDQLAKKLNSSRQFGMPRAKSNSCQNSSNETPNS